MAAVTWPWRVARGHPRTIAGAAAGLAAYALLPRTLGTATRVVLGWDVGALVLLVLAAVMFTRIGTHDAIAANAERQQEGEWTMLWITLLGVVVSIVALTQELGGVKDAAPGTRALHVALVAGTLLLSWLVTHTVFAMRYAHEYYQGRAGGLDFPSEDRPDYWDFLYFALTLGMTFQASDVAITSRKMRRLAIAHGLIAFLFSTVIVALTVNIAASLLR